MRVWLRRSWSAPSGWRSARKRSGAGVDHRPPEFHRPPHAVRPAVDRARSSRTRYRRPRGWFDTPMRPRPLYRATPCVSGASVIVDSTRIPSYAFLLRRVPAIDLRCSPTRRETPAGSFTRGRSPWSAETQTGGPDRMLRYGAASASGRYLMYNATADLVPSLATCRTSSFDTKTWSRTPGCTLRTDRRVRRPPGRCRVLGQRHGHHRCQVTPWTGTPCGSPRDASRSGPMRSGGRCMDQSRPAGRLHPNPPPAQAVRLLLRALCGIGPIAVVQRDRALAC